MKKITSFIAMLTLLTLIFVGCSQKSSLEEVVEETRTAQLLTEPTTTNASEITRNPFLNPCYPTTYDIVPWGQQHCEMVWGAFWRNGRCYLCH